MQLSRENNFDIIRLLAALQVVYVHASKHLHWPNNDNSVILHYLGEFIEKFPGVPIFFTVSGFLVYWSIERNKNDLKRFFKNRALRVFPGLWVCLIITTFLLLIFKSLEYGDLSTKEFFYWFVGQISFFQFYTPDILRDFGVGTPNGSLWTITVEIQYYLILPIIFYLMLKLKKNYQKNLLLLTIIFISLGFAYFIKLSFDQSDIISKLSKVSVFTYLYNFIFGIFMYINWEKIKKYLINKAKYWFIVYIFYIVLFYFIGGMYGKGYVPNIFGIIGFLLLAILTISFAYSKPTLSKILKAQDISYGVYIYHMLVINVLITLKVAPEASFILSFLFSIIIGVLSWHFVEKRALKLKRRW